MHLIRSFCIFAAVSAGATAAHAGQPWSCLCDGRPTRNIASTYACEVSLHKATGRRVRSGSKLLVPRCTAPQFRAWNRRACARGGCTLLRSGNGL
jgi:hypothetical protein